jgi:hypothetical protein
VRSGTEARDGTLPNTSSFEQAWEYFQVAELRQYGMSVPAGIVRGRWPWDDAYQGVRGGQPVLGQREPTQWRRRAG